MVTKKQLANLRPIRSTSEARERGRKGGQASGKARRRLKSFRELDDERTTDDERIEMLEALKLKAKRGNLKAFEIYRDTMGMNPIKQDSTQGAEDDGQPLTIEIVYGAPEDGGDEK